MQKEMLLHHVSRNALVKIPAEAEWMNLTVAVRGVLTSTVLFQKTMTRMGVMTLGMNQSHQNVSLHLCVEWVHPSSVMTERLLCRLQHLVFHLFVSVKSRLLL
jgi:hypothetical protein